MMTIDSFSAVMPEVYDMYGGEKKFNIILNPEEPMDDEAFTTFLSRNNKMTYRKDGLDLTVALPFAFQAEVRRRHWETFRTGYMAMEFSGNFLHTYEDGLGHIVLQKPLV